MKKTHISNIKDIHTNMCKTRLLELEQSKAIAISDTIYEHDEIMKSVEKTMEDFNKCSDRETLKWWEQFKHIFKDHTQASRRNFHNSLGLFPLLILAIIFPMTAAFKGVQTYTDDNLRIGNMIFQPLGKKRMNQKRAIVQFQCTPCDQIIAEQAIKNLTGQIQSHCETSFLDFTIGHLNDTGSMVDHEGPFILLPGTMSIAASRESCENIGGNVAEAISVADKLNLSEIMKRNNITRIYAGISMNHHMERYLFEQSKLQVRKIVSLLHNNKIYYHDGSKTYLPKATTVRELGAKYHYTMKIYTHDLPFYYDKNVPKANSHDDSIELVAMHPEYINNYVTQGLRTICKLREQDAGPTFHKFKANCYRDVKEAVHLRDVTVKNINNIMPFQLPKRPYNPASLMFNPNMTYHNKPGFPSIRSNDHTIITKEKQKENIEKICREHIVKELQPQRKKRFLLPAVWVGIGASVLGAVFSLAAFTGSALHFNYLQNMVTVYNDEIEIDYDLLVSIMNGKEEISTITNSSLALTNAEIHRQDLIDSIRQIHEDTMNSVNYVTSVYINGENKPTSASINKQEVEKIADTFRDLFDIDVSTNMESIITTRLHNDSAYFTFLEFPIDDDAQDVQIMKIHSLPIFEKGIKKLPIVDNQIIAFYASKPRFTILNKETLQSCLISKRCNSITPAFTPNYKYCGINSYYNRDTNLDECQMKNTTDDFPTFITLGREVFYSINGSSIVSIYCEHESQRQQTVQDNQITIKNIGKFSIPPYCYAQYEDIKIEANNEGDTIHQLSTDDDYQEKEETTKSEWNYSPVKAYNTFIKWTDPNNILTILITTLTIASLILLLVAICCCRKYCCRSRRQRRSYETLPPPPIVRYNHNNDQNDSYARLYLNNTNQSDTQPLIPLNNTFNTIPRSASIPIPIPSAPSLSTILEDNENRTQKTSTPLDPPANATAETLNRTQNGHDTADNSTQSTTNDPETVNVPPPMDTANVGITTFKM